MGGILDEERERQLKHRLQSIHQRVQWMANEEARFVWVKGLAARGSHLIEKERLLDETDRILDELEGRNADRS
jgi:hypothetical protein